MNTHKSLLLSVVAIFGLSCVLPTTATQKKTSITRRILRKAPGVTVGTSFYAAAVGALLFSEPALRKIYSKIPAVIVTNKLPALKNYQEKMAFLASLILSKQSAFLSAAAGTYIIYRTLRSDDAMQDEDESVLEVPAIPVA